MAKLTIEVPDTKLEFYKTAIASFVNRNLSEEEYEDFLLGLAIHNSTSESNVEYVEADDFLKKLGR